MHYLFFKIYYHLVKHAQNLVIDMSLVFTTHKSTSKMQKPRFVICLTILRTDKHVSSEFWFCGENTRLNLFSQIILLQKLTLDDLPSSNLIGPADIILNI